MGNVLGHQQPDWVPNIAPDAGRGNNVNYPISSQITDAFLSYTIPTLTMVIFAKVAYASHKDRVRLQTEYETRLVALRTELEQLRLSTDLEYAQQAANRRISERIGEIQREEHLAYDDQLKKLDWYDEGLKNILHIRCSPFKSHRRRAPLERELLDKVATDHSIHDVNVYQCVRDSIEYDHKYCGSSRETNGKLRQIYMRLYRDKLKLAMERKVLKRLESEL